MIGVNGAATNRQSGEVLLLGTLHATESALIRKSSHTHNDQVTSESPASPHQAWRPCHLLQAPPWLRPLLLSSCVTGAFGT